jgi:hypothetical protein
MADGNIPTIWYIIAAVVSILIVVGLFVFLDIERDEVQGN